MGSRIRDFLAKLTVMRMHLSAAREFELRVKLRQSVDDRCHSCYGFFHKEKNCPLKDPRVREAYDEGVPHWFERAVKALYHVHIPAIDD
jgi:hypothetical protein